MKGLQLSALAFITAASSGLLQTAAAASVDIEDSDLSVSGRIMVDQAFYDGIHNNQQMGSAWTLRRARLALKHKPKKDWQAELEVSVDQEDSSISVTDGYLLYKGWKSVDLQIGHMKEPFGLENLTSAMVITTLERSMVTEAFAPGRNYGVALLDDSDNYSWNLGFYSASEDDSGLDGYALTGRLTLSPINTGTRLLHLGVSGSVRDMQGTDFDINQSAEVDPARKIIETREIVADAINQFSLEGGLVYKSFSLQTEWMQQYVQEAEVATTDASVSFSGHYVLASFFLTGQSRGYGGGTFDDVDVTDTGAWELVARYSSVDLVDGEEGVTADTALLGVNYYANSRVRVMLNIARADIVAAEAADTGRGNSVSLRFQYGF